MKLKLMLFFIGLLVTGALMAQSVDQLTGTKSRSGTADPNIKQTEVVNTLEGPAGFVQPVAKGGVATRGQEGCKVIFDNYTRWYIKCYVDGDYRGVVCPWGDSSFWVGSGSTRAYAVAEFTDGSRLTWGPITRECNGEWTVKINP
jgi:hypothetical protein